MEQFAELTPMEQRSWYEFTVNGPSELRIIETLHQMKLIMTAYATGKPRTSKEPVHWRDGLFKDPSVVQIDRRKEEIKQFREHRLGMGKWIAERMKGK